MAGVSWQGDVDVLDARSDREIDDATVLNPRGTQSQESADHTSTYRRRVRIVERESHVEAGVVRLLRPNPDGSRRVRSDFRIGSVKHHRNVVGRSERREQRRTVYRDRDRDPVLIRCDRRVKPS